MAHAQDPKFVYGTPAPNIEKAVWKASAQAGLILATGNANNLTLSGGAALSRVDSRNKIALDVNAAYGRATNYIANDKNGDQLLSGPDEIDTSTQTNSKMWNVKVRYDRFFSKNNLGYVSVLVAGNEPAGKLVYGGAQAGYSRQPVSYTHLDVYKRQHSGRDLEQFGERLRERGRQRRRLGRQQPGHHRRQHGPELQRYRRAGCRRPGRLQQRCRRRDQFTLQPE